MAASEVCRECYQRISLEMAESLKQGIDRCRL
jgi:hypothetical protein